jgi:hypothetical protein
VDFGGGTLGQQGGVIRDVAPAALTLGTANGSGNWLVGVIGEQAPISLPWFPGSGDLMTPFGYFAGGRCIRLRSAP